MSIAKEATGSFGKSWFLEGFVDKPLIAKNSNPIFALKKSIKASNSDTAEQQSSMHKRTLDVAAGFVQKSIDNKDAVAVAAPDRWNEEDQSLVDWYIKNKSGLPMTPYTLKGPGTFVPFLLEVRYPALWYLQVDKEIKQGPNGRRAKTGLLQRDLKCLKKHMQVFAY